MKHNKVIFGRKALLNQIKNLKRRGKKIVFTNGCYDIIHAGHIRFLRKAKKLGGALVVAVNSDSSVRRIKSKKRPVVPQRERAEVLSALESVDIVTVFYEDDPYRIISAVKPDVLVKGGDWKINAIIGADVVRKNGGKVRNIKYEKGKSTTGIIRKVMRNYR